MAWVNNYTPVLYLDVIAYPDDQLPTQGARARIAMVLTLFFSNNLHHKDERLSQSQDSIGIITIMVSEKSMSWSVKLLSFIFRWHEEQNSNNITFISLWHPFNWICLTACVCLDCCKLKLYLSLIFSLCIVSFCQWTRTSDRRISIKSQMILLRA